MNNNFGSARLSLHIGNFKCQKRSSQSNLTLTKLGKVAGTAARIALAA